MLRENTMEIFKAGQNVRITFEGQTVVGKVKITSDRGMSLMLEFDSLLGGYLRLLPCRLSERDNVFLDLIENLAVKVESASGS